ncbi:RDD family protein [Mastigocladopsis repens]|uniref:RDD family protein n=1 Tax=Mastigocladopsis repens TaxID=221287 RepID=UPI00030848C4|nr:RDD family protein [Mastigocladopsis repens]
MSIEQVPPKHYPKVEFGRRGLALGIDFLCVWIVSSLLGSSQLGVQIVQILVFAIGWGILRIIVPYNNQGQSLGRYAFDIKVLELERGKIPDMQSLLKREGIVGLSALLVSVALSNILRNPTAILLLIPLAIDCGAALSDTQQRQALHDRYAKTMVVSSHRGYSLDIKVKRLVEKGRRNMRQ